MEVRGARVGGKGDVGTVGPRSVVIPRGVACPRPSWGKQGETGAGAHNADHEAAARIACGVSQQGLHAGNAAASLGGGAEGRDARAFSRAQARGGIERSSR